MRVSVLIVTWNSERTIEECLRCVEACEPAQILIWDNNSADGTVAAVARAGQATALRVAPENRGFAGGMNALAEEAEGDVLLLLNPDAYLHADSMRELVRAYERMENPGVVGGKLVAPDGTPQLACARPFPTAVGLAAWVLTGRRQRWDLPAAESSVEAVSGACMLVGARLWDAVGGLDSGYPHGGEDLELCLRARQLGLGVRFVPGAVASHELEASVRQATPEIDVLRWVGTTRFLEHCEGRQRAAALRWLLAARVGGVLLLQKCRIVRVSPWRLRRAQMLWLWATRGVAPGIADVGLRGD